MLQNDLLQYKHHILLPLLIIFILSAVQSQNEVPVISVDSEYVTEWLVLGPFLPNNLGYDFLAPDSGEAQCRPRLGDIFVTAAGETLTWKFHKANQPVVNLLHAIGNYTNASAYAYCELHSDTGGKRYLLVGSDDGVAVWINGKRVHYNPVARSLYLDQDMVEVAVKKGINHCLVKVTQGSGNWGFSLRLIPDKQPVVITPKFFLFSEDLQNEIYLSGSMWKYHSGDNPEWAAPDFNDHDWEYINPELRRNALPESGWDNTGWFRLHFIADSELAGRPLGVTVWQAGESQLYLDGKLIYTFSGDFNDGTGMPKTLVMGKKEPHVIAVRYTNSNTEKFQNAGEAAGFYLRLGYVDEMAENRIQYERPLIGFQMFFTALPLAIGLLHLILFMYLPGLKQNLYFALFLFSYAAAIFFDYRTLLAADIGQQLFSLRMHSTMLPFWILFQLMFVYSLFYKKLPMQLWIISLGAFGLGALAVYRPSDYFDLFGIVYIVLYIEINRVIFLALYRKKEGAWIIAMGFLVFFFFGAIDTLLDKGIIESFGAIENPYALGSVGVFIAMSIYLSRDFARANKRIVEQTMEQKLLEAENERQSKELEEARILQLSMLPKDLPRLSHLEIGVFMKTATEVGGDYYDFHLSDDGTLSIAIGDATGHGMKAGTMVASMKSLFGTYDENCDIPLFFNRCSQSIRRMNLGNLYMAMQLIRITGGKMMASSAGMPPVLIYRRKHGTIEEIVMKGMPLGGASEFPYQLREADLEKGDTVLLMSDGFAELFNDRGEMLDYSRVKEIFKEAVDKPADETANHLFNAGERWRNGQPQHDDITFVVLKVKNLPPGIPDFQK